MVNLISLIILIVFVTLLIAPQILYFAWMKSKAKKNWTIQTDSSYILMVSLIVSTYNEARVIDKKLANIQEMDYPEDKVEVIVVDSASTDNTLSVCQTFLENNTFRFPIKLVSEEKRLGKSHALNTALESVHGEIIATSDADSMWEPNALREAVSYFADSSIGAVTGKEKISNLEESVHTMSEGLYRNFYYTLRLGESKIHSTLIFQGELSLYRRSILGKFEDRPGYSDDTGTIINILSKGYRCIFVPDAVFHDMAAQSMKGKLTLKSRRAEHLVAGIIQASKYNYHRTIKLHPSVIAFNFYLYVLTPFLITASIIALLVFVFFEPLFLCILLPLILIMLAVKKTRIFAFSYLTSNIALAMGLFRHFFGKKESTWTKIDEMRQK